MINDAKKHFVFSAEAGYIYNDDKIVIPYTDWSCISNVPAFAHAVDSLPENPQENDVAFVVPAESDSPSMLTHLENSLTNMEYSNYKPIAKVEIESIIPEFPVPNYEGFKNTDSGIVLFDFQMNKPFCVVLSAANETIDKPFLTIYEEGLEESEDDDETENNGDNNGGDSGDEGDNALIYIQAGTTISIPGSAPETFDEGGWRWMSTFSPVTETSNTLLSTNRDCYIFDLSELSTDDNIVPSMSEEVRSFFDSIVKCKIHNGVYVYKGGLWRGIDWS